MKKKLSCIILFIAVCGFISQYPGVYPVFSANAIRPTRALLRPLASKITHNAQFYSGFLVEDFRQAEEALITALLARGEAGLFRDKIEEYIDMIKKFPAPNFSHKVFFKKTLLLLDSKEPLIEEFALKSFIAVAEALLAGGKGYYNESKVLGISGEISGIYELINRFNTSLRHIRVGKVKAINTMIKEGDTERIIKEFDACSENSVFEFKFNLTLQKLYEQVVGLSRTRISHFKVLSLPEFSYIRNLVYFGENEGGNVMKAVLDFVEKRPLSSRITVSSKGSLSVKFDIGEFHEFIFDKATLEYARREKPSRFRGDFFNSSQAKNARAILLEKSRQVPEGEHFDVIIGVSNPDPGDLAKANRIVYGAGVKATGKKIMPSSSKLNRMRYNEGEYRELHKEILFLQLIDKAV